MLFQYWFALAAALTPLSSSAQHHHSTRISSDTAGIEYRSAFRDYKSFTEDEGTPAARWRAANNEVGKLGGHAGHMKGNGDTSGVTSMPGGSATAEKESAPVDHSKHHH